MEIIPLRQTLKALEEVLKLYPRLLLSIWGASFLKPKSYSVIQERIDEFSIIDSQLKPEVNLKGANLESAVLKSVNFKYANLAGANLKNANLENANFSYANLEGADLKNANLRNTNFRGALLIGANLDGADLEGANLSSAKFKETNNAEVLENV